MPKKKTKREDIRDPERYFAKWLHFEKKHNQMVQYEQSQQEISLDALEEADGQISFFHAVNKEGELYRAAEAEVAAFAWMEEIRDEKLYQAVESLS